MSLAKAWKKKAITESAKRARLQEKSRMRVALLEDGSIVYDTQHATFTITPGKDEILRVDLKVARVLLDGTWEPT